jgi:hypothetical protein
MALSTNRIAFSWRALSLSLLSASPGWAVSGTPVARSPHHLVVMGERAWSALDVAGDAYYNIFGNYYGGTASYLYQGFPWLEWGGTLSYGHTNYEVTDQLFVGGQVRAGLALDSARRVELGLSMSVGLPTFIVPGVPDDAGRGSRTHVFLGGAAGAGPDFRIWVFPAWALTLAGNARIGSTQDIVDTRGLNLIDHGDGWHFGVQLGVVSAL